MQLQTEPLLQAFDDALALIEDEAQRERFARVLAASRPAVDRAAYELVGEVVESINDALGDDARVQLSVIPDGVTVAVTRPEADEAAPSITASTEEMERLTLRLPADVKEQASRLAAEAAMSLNTWIVRSVARALARELERGERRRRTSRRGRLRGRVGD